MSASSQTYGCISLTASPTEGRAPLTVNFSGKGFEQGHSINQYEFDFGDASGGQPKTVREVSSDTLHRYYNPGTYTASLKVLTSSGQWVGGQGCKKTISIASTTGSSSTNVTILPKTGIGDYLGILLVVLIFGFYLRRHFKLA